MYWIYGRAVPEQRSPITRTRSGRTLVRTKHPFSRTLKRMFIFEDPDPPEGSGHSQEGLVITKTEVFGNSDYLY